MADVKEDVPVKDPENGNDVKNDESGNGDGEDMSLADLLGGDIGDDAEAPKRVDQRDDEPDSGMVNLAKMVADSSVETAKTPSIMPPPAAPADQTGRTDTTGQVAAAPAPVAQEKKSSGPIYALIAVVVIAAIVVVVVMMSGGDEGKGDDAANQALLAKFEALEKEQKAFEEKMAAVEAERKQAEEAKTALQAQLAGMAAKGDGGNISAEEQAKMDEIQKQLDEAKAKEEELAKEAEEAEQKAAEAKKKAADTKKKSGSSKVASSGGKKDTGKKDTGKKDTGKKDTGKKGTGKKDTGKKDTGKKDTGKKGSAAELDSLLGGGEKKKDAPKETKPAGPALPRQLSQAQVKSGMMPVQARAQKMCAKYSTGVVQVKLVIGGNGRVKSANPKGAFANSTAGKCVAMQARTAKFPKFSDASQSVLFPISLK
jgi:hypothetical protein